MNVVEKYLYPQGYGNFLYGFAGSLGFVLVEKYLYPQGYGSKYIIYFSSFYFSVVKYLYPQGLVINVSVNETYLMIFNVID